MDADPIIIAELVAQYTDDPAGLETIRKQAFTAYAARQTTNIILNSRGRDASTSAGIPLNTQESQRAFILACQMAARSFRKQTVFSRPPE